jgi:hypothetical protein
MLFLPVKNTVNIWQHHIRLVASLLVGSLTWALLSIPAVAAEQNSLLFRPHCEEQDQSLCPAFDVFDPQTLVTNPLSSGDTLDVDIIVQNPSGDPLKKVRAWLSYDSSILEGVSITFGPNFPILIPGEADFSESEGLVKISAQTDEGKETSNPQAVIARVIFKVKENVSTTQSPISFYDPSASTTGHTYVLPKASTTSVLHLPLGSLLVKVNGSLVQSSQNTESSRSSNSSTPTVAPTSILLFTQLQVQNVRATTDSNSLLLAWDTLQSGQVQGYNVYYGTQMGRYLQKRSLPSTATSVAIRNLPVGDTYYAAVRAVNAQNEESAFSQEVAVEIGKPSTSTAPLHTLPGGNSQNTAPSNPLGHQNGTTTVPGEAGLPSLLIILVFMSAIIGTFFAMRKQAVATKKHI